MIYPWSSKDKLILSEEGKVDENLDPVPKGGSCKKLMSFLKIVLAVEIAIFIGYAFFSIYQNEFNGLSSREENQSELASMSALKDQKLESYNNFDNIKSQEKTSDFESQPKEDIFKNQDSSDSGKETDKSHHPNSLFSDDTKSVVKVSSDSLVKVKTDSEIPAESKSEDKITEAMNEEKEKMKNEEEKTELTNEEEKSEPTNEEKEKIKNEEEKTVLTNEEEKSEPTNEEKEKTDVLQMNNMDSENKEDSISEMQPPKGSIIKSFYFRISIPKNKSEVDEEKENSQAVAEKDSDAPVYYRLYAHNYQRTNLNGEDIAEETKELPSKETNTESDPPADDLTSMMKMVDTFDDLMKGLLDTQDPPKEDTIANIFNENLFQNPWQNLENLDEKSENDSDPETLFIIFPNENESSIIPEVTKTQDEVIRSREGEINKLEEDLFRYFKNLDENLENPKDKNEETDFPKLSDVLSLNANNFMQEMEEDAKNFETLSQSVADENFKNWMFQGLPLQSTLNQDVQSIEISDLESHEVNDSSPEYIY